MRLIAWMLLPLIALADAHVVAAEDQTASEVLVVNTQGASVSRVDLAGMKEVGRFQVGERPYGIAVTPDGKTVAV